MRRTLSALVLCLAMLVVGAHAAAAQDDPTTTMASSIPLEQDDSTTTTAADGATTLPVDDPGELAATGSRDTLATLGLGFLLLGVGCVTLGAARRLLVVEGRRHS